MLILLSWLDEFHESWHESAIESLAVLGVWLVVFYFTRRLVSRLYYLEGFLPVCAWCKKIHYKEQWGPLEKYFSEGFRTETTHGMCPECARKVRNEAGLEAESGRKAIRLGACLKRGCGREPG